MFRPKGPRTQIIGCWGPNPVILMVFGGRVYGLGNNGLLATFRKFGLLFFVLLGSRQGLGHVLASEGPCVGELPKCEVGNFLHPKGPKVHVPKNWVLRSLVLVVVVQGWGSI